MAKEEWWSAPAESDNGRTIIVTGRDFMDKEISSGKYDVRIEVSWNYASLPDGMPDGESARILEEVTDALSEALKKEKGVVMTGIYTGDGKREWIFYSKNPRIFSSVFNRALEPFPVLPLEIEAYSDPDWEEYREMRELTYIPPEDE